MSHILIAEDDPYLARFVDKGLRADGHGTLVVHDGADAERLALSGEFDLLLLDLGLPGRGGFQVLQAVRGSGTRLAILVLTGRRERDVVACLNAGADDYMTKPFQMDELLARVRTRLRSGTDHDPTVLRAGGVTLDLRSRQAMVGGRSVDLRAASSPCSRRSSGTPARSSAGSSSCPGCGGTTPTRRATWSTFT